MSLDHLKRHMGYQHKSKGCNRNTLIVQPFQPILIPLLHCRLLPCLLLPCQLLWVGWPALLKGGYLHSSLIRELSFGFWFLWEGGEVHKSRLIPTPSPGATMATLRSYQVPYLKVMERGKTWFPVPNKTKRAPVLTGRKKVEFFKRRSKEEALRDRDSCTHSARQIPK